MRGLTLIETILYIALWSFIMSSVMLTVYGIAQNGDLFAKRNVASDEGEFVTAKLNWALGDMASITTPSSGSGSSLSITRNDGTVVEVRLTGDVIEMRIAGGSYIPLTTANVSVSSLEFTRISGTPAGIQASTTIDGINFMTRRYLRQ